MKKTVLISLTLCMLLSLCACVGKKDTLPTPKEDNADKTTETFAEKEDFEETNVVASEIAIGDTLSTEFVEMTFEELTIAEDIKYSVENGSLTITSGPEPISGQLYVCISGKIKNTSKSPLSVSSYFFVGEMNIDGYKYSINSADCEILDGKGMGTYSIDPLTEYVFRFYKAIPESLANSYTSAAFRFGFFDLFDTEELRKNASEEDPISLCPYQYILSLNQDAVTMKNESNAIDVSSMEEADDISANSSRGDNDKSEKEIAYWDIGYYVDDFNQLTDEAFITLKDYVSGTFSNSATTNAKLDADVYVDINYFTFFLYEYGKYQVKNNSSRNVDNYNITMRTADGTDYYLTGTVYCGGDRLFIDQAYMPTVIDALCHEEDEFVSFYIEEADHTLSSYLFTVPTGNFAKLYEELFQQV